MPRLIANTANMPREEWLKLRKEGIGGSDASAVAGANKYSSPVMVYMDKLDFHIPEKPDRVMEAAHFGNVLEPVVREEFKRRLNSEREENGLEPIKLIHRQAIFAHDEYDFIRTNLDGIIYCPDRGRGVFEAKTAHYMLREEWEGEDVPNQYYIQVQHNMMVMNVEYAYLAVLIGGNTYKHYYIERDQEFIDYLISIEKAFWENHILQRIPPEMSGHDAEKDMLRDQYPQSEHSEGYITNLPDGCIQMIEAVDAAKEAEKRMKTESTKWENEIKAIMGTTEQAYAGNHRITWRTSSNGQRRFTYKLDAESDKEKYYNSLLRDEARARREFEKERKEIARGRRAAEREVKKIRKEKQKAEKQAMKEAKAALKAEKELAKKVDKELTESEAAEK